MNIDYHKKSLHIARAVKMAAGLEGYVQSASDPVDIFKTLQNSKLLCLCVSLRIL